MLSLASLEDVKRVLRFTDDDVARDAQLRASLAAVESLMEGRLRWVRDGSALETYFDIPEDATLRLPAKDIVVTKVRVYSSTGLDEAADIMLGDSPGYDLSDSGDLILRPTLFASPFEGATASRRLRTYSRVEVNYTGTGQVPRAITEGIAILAAGHWQDGPRSLQGLTSEKIGDYSYTLGGAGDREGEEPSFFQRAMVFLSDHLKRSRVSVT